MPAQPSIGGTPPTAQTMNPLVQGMIQRYASLPTEKLAELQARLGGTQQGQLINRLLMQRRMMPAQNPDPQQQQQQMQQAPQQPIPQPQGQFRHGGTIPVPRMTDGLKAGGSLPVFQAEQRKAGGVTGPNRTPVDLSDGEFVVSPEHVDRIGGGDRKRGHRILDKWVLEQRRKHIKKLQKLPPPVKT
jgi:hypothetical protein